jgi:hypothetical protein
MYGVIGFIFEGLNIMPNTLPFERRKKNSKRCKHFKWGTFNFEANN